MASEKSVLLVFLTSLRAGGGKPLLSEGLGAETAMLVHRRVVRDLFQGLQGMEGGHALRILCDPPAHETFIRAWMQELWHQAAPRPQFAPQLHGDYGDRLRHAFREAFAEGFERVLAIGSSCPSISAAILRQAEEALGEADVVYGPSPGGGYYLIGCSRFEPRLFDVPWNSETTLRTSLARAAESGMSTRLLPSLPLVETVSEWNAYKEEILRHSATPKAPLVFQPLYQKRIWGGRALETKLARTLPAGWKVGESWELADRPGAKSVLSEGPLMGVTLGDLWTHRRREIFGPEARGDRFPLLVKILDAQEDLSLQVHPPEWVAAELGGEPKTETWYVAAAAPGARIYAGLRKGVTPEAFRAGLQKGTAASMVHSFRPAVGDSIFIPSGRLHAIGAGLLIYEIQENSDTTYRVFDWNRTGEDGKPRKLHLDEALRSIDFRDIEPGVNRAGDETLVQCPKFQVRKWNLQPHQTRAANDADRFAVVTVVEGAVHCGGRQFREGDCFLIPACAAHELDLRAGEQPAAILHISVPLEPAPQPLRRLEVSRETEGFYQQLRRRIVAWAESRTGGRGHPWLKYILLAPDFFLLLAGLLSDREVPMKWKALLASAIAYFMVPLDLLPEGLLGPAAYLDDIALAAFAINKLLNHLNPDIIRRHWAGEGDVLALVQSIIARVDTLIGSGLVRQIRDKLGL